MIQSIQTPEKKSSVMCQYYDCVQQSVYGPAYAELTSATLHTMQEIVPTGSTILDFGAGTGRLSLPLCDRGYNSVAIEPSVGMLMAMKQKMESQDKTIPTYNCSISEYKGEKGDLALAVEVLDHIIEEDDMRAALSNISKHLNDGGYLLFDLKDQHYFQNRCDEENLTGDLTQYCTLESTPQANVYLFTEECAGSINSEDFEYSDSFNLRDWKWEELDAMLKEVGLVDTGKELTELNRFGSTYRLYQKRVNH